MKKIVATLWIFSLLTAGFSFQTVFAAEPQGESGLEMGTLIPASDPAMCDKILLNLERSSNPKGDFLDKTIGEQDNILSCAIRTGRIHFWMVPYYIVYLIEFLIGIAGLLAVLFLVIGGFKYVTSGISESKDKAKGTIRNALIGLGIALAAWTVVNLIQYIVTY